jgi:hypothetical protein
VKAVAKVIDESDLFFSLYLPAGLVSFGRSDLTAAG